MIKIKTTEPFNDGIYCKGKVVLRRTKTGIDPNLNLKEYYKPIVISETESVYIGDKVYNTILGTIHNVETSHDVLHYNQTKGRIAYKKILVLPEQFSSQTLNDIAEGRIKDGDSVIVDCIAEYDTCKHCFYNQGGINSPDCCGQFTADYQIKLTNNYANVVVPVKEEDQPHEIHEAFATAMKIDNSKSTYEHLQDAFYWFNKNYHLIKKVK